MSETKKAIRKIVLDTRRENEKSIDILTENGMQLVDIQPNTIEDFTDAGHKTAQALIGKLYDEELLNQVHSLLDEYRNQK